jgi:hypothetical protein
LKTLEPEKRGFLSAREDASEKENKGSSEGTNSRNESNRLDRLEAKLAKLISEKGSSKSICSINESNHLINASNQKLSHNTKKCTKNSTDQRVFHNTKNYTRISANNNCSTLGLRTNTMQNCTKWVIDSGAIDHMTGNQELLNNYQKIYDDQFFTVANNDKIKIKG